MNKNENKWSCSVCTYDNYPASSKCSVCLHPRGSEVIKLPPANSEKPLVINDIEATSKNQLYSDFIICPPSCSSKDEEEKKKSTATVGNSKLLKSVLNTDDDVASNSLNNVSTVSWTCATCTFPNMKNNTRCSQCSSLKSSTNATSESCQDSQEACFSKTSNNKSEKWICKICTYENWNASKKCVVCLNSKGAAANSLATDFPENSKSIKNDNLSIPSSSNLLAENVERLSSKNKNSAFKQKSKRDLSTQSNTSAYDTATRSTDPVIEGYNIRHTKSRSPSLSSNSSHSGDDNRAQGSANQTRSRQRRKKDYQASSSMNDISNNQRSSNSGKQLSRSNSSNHLYSPGRFDVIDNRPYKSRTRNLNWLFLKACIGVVDGNAEAVDAYLSHGGNIARCLTLDEINSLDRPSAFDVGHTLVHLAIRFQRHNILALLLTPEIAPRGFKRNPAHLSPDIAELIRLEIMASLRTIKGDFHCRFLSECCTFQLPIEICDLPSSIQQLLFNELLDQDVQKELEDELAINWSPSLLRIGDCSNRLYALWNRSAGDCLLDSVLQATWGVFDRDNVLRNAMSESLQDCATRLQQISDRICIVNHQTQRHTITYGSIFHQRREFRLHRCFFKRWRDWELQQADLIGYTLTERQCLQDWTFIHSLAQQPGASLEHCHVFVLSHILRRPIIVYGIKYLKSFHGDTLGFAKFQGVYLPSLWDQSFCYTSPIALGYTRGHFTALVTMENDSKDIRASSRHRNPFNSVKYLPLVDSDGKILPIHFTAKTEGKTEEQRKEILHEWLDCYDTDDGFLMARQRPGKRPPSLTRLIDGWLDHYRHMAFRRLGEEGDSDENDE